MADWTAEVIGRMHTARITQLMLAKECGYAPTYLSTVLHGKKGNEDTKRNVLDALLRLERRLGVGG